MEQFENKGASIREILREHTHHEHQRLHRHSSFAALFRGNLGIREYRQLVRHLYGFYAPLDRAICRAMAGAAANTSGYSYTCRSGFLAQDLLDLGYSENTVREARHCGKAFGLVSPSTIGGVLYVIEGATLGGTHIDRAAHRLLRHDHPAGRRYWSWCRSVSHERWPATNRHLEHLVAEGVAISDLKKGALDTFRLLAEWLAPLDSAHSGLKPEQA